MRLALAAGIGIARSLLLIALVLCAAAAAGCGRTEQPGGVQPDGPSDIPRSGTSSDDVAVVLEADERLTAALEAGDATALDGLLDVEFTWLVPAGVVRPRVSILASAPPPAIARSRGVSPDARRYGANVVVVQRHDGQVHGMHVWVRRSADWRLLHISEVAEGERVVYGGTMMGAAECVNPCKVVPFVPATAAESAVMEAWQAQQSGPDQWARHIPDDNIARTSNGSYTKADRVAVQMQQVRAGTVVAPSPLLWARLWEFGDAALMLALQPRAVGKPFWGSRVFELRDGVWMMAESYQVTIQDMPPF